MMKFAFRVGCLILLATGCTFAAYAQPRPVSPTAPTKSAPPPATATAQPGGTTAQPAPPPAPANVKAKYEGGVFGYNKKQDGTLQFDEVNSRLVFRNKEGKEMLSFPYSSLQQVYPANKAVQPMAATVIGSLPLPYGANIPAWFVRKKVRYMTFQFSDTNIRGGLTSFKISDKELLASMIAALCDKAQLTTQGDSCYRPQSNRNGQIMVAPIPRQP